jgi:hypothetical protein
MGSLEGVSVLFLPSLFPASLFLVVSSQATPIEVELKIVNNNKDHLVKMSKDSADVSHHVNPVDHDNWGDEHHLPPLLHTGPAHRGETEGWTKFEGDILYVLYV